MPFRGSKLTGACLENLKGLRALPGGILFTNEPPLTDSDLVHLRGLTGLRMLQLPVSRRTVITDAGLVNLRDMVDMRRLELAWGQGGRFDGVDLSARNNALD